MTTESTMCAPHSATESQVVKSVPRALVVVTGDDVYEDLFTAALELQALLVEVGFAARVAMGVGCLTAASEHDERLVVLYTASGQFGSEAQRELERRVMAGTGLIAVHASNVLPTEAALAELIGSRYESHGPHPHQSRFRVELDRRHQMVREIEPFEVSHEHYVLELRAPVVAVAWRETGYGCEPLVHVRQKGEGRVCYIQFGHDMRSWGEPGVRQLVRRAALWAAGEAS
jgi:type 1 glutamine amidotransferase